MAASVPAARRLLRAKDLADARFFEPLAVADLAAAAGLSPAHFSRQFKATFGESPHQYLLTRRLERAAALLCATDWSVAAICFAVGAQSLGSFTASFHRVFGMAPLAYRAAYPPAERHLRIPRTGGQGRLVAKGAGGTLFLETDDCQAAYDDLPARGVKFNDPPTKQPYGIDTSFRDPSGNNIRLTQVLEFDPERV